MELQKLFINKGKTALDILGIKSKTIRLSLDSPVAAIFDGKLIELDEPVLHDGYINIVPYKSSHGVRIYRSTLQFVFAYAVNKVLKEDGMLSSYALSDGYLYFSKNRVITSEDVQQIYALMKEIISSCEPISYEYMDQEYAISFFREHHMLETANLLETRNEPTVKVSRLRDYCKLNYMPLCPNTGILSSWGLVSFRKGIVLRHPPRDASSIKLNEWKSLDSIFDKFKKFWKYESNFGVNTVAELNKITMSKGLKDFIGQCEAAQSQKIFQIAIDIHKRKTTKVVFIAGPSSSNKTTFAHKLSQDLTVLGYKTIRISLDDYYFTKDKVPRDENGEPDLECLASIDVELFKENINKLVRGEGVNFPRFEFNVNKIGRRTYDTELTYLGENTIIVVEGIHGLNPKICEGVDPDKIYKIFISALIQMNLDENTRVSTTDVRILRRLIRDYRTRYASAEETLGMWASVTRGEREYIFPYQWDVNAIMNSALDYELPVLAPLALSLLKTVRPSAGEGYMIAQRLLQFINNIYPISKDLVPSNSMLGEFIGV